MSGLPDVPAARVIEAIEGLLFAAEEKVSWDMVKSARRLLGSLLPEEPGPVLGRVEWDALPPVPTPVALEEPPPGPPPPPRRSPSPRGSTSGRGALQQAILDAMTPVPQTVAEIAEASGVERRKVSVALAKLCIDGRVKRTGYGVYISA